MGELLLAGAFLLFLILFAGKTGLRAIFSFVLTVLMIWKALVPLYLAGAQPVVTGLAVSAVLTVLIITLVYGFERRAAARCPARCWASSSPACWASCLRAFSDSRRGDVPIPKAFYTAATSRLI